MIKFKTVRYKNFLSTGNKFSEIVIDDTRTTLLIGPNGSGNLHLWMLYPMASLGNLSEKSS